MSANTDVSLDRCSGALAAEGFAAGHLSSAFLEQRAFAAGDAIVDQGAASWLPFVICRGWAARAVALSNERKQLVNFMLPGDLFDLQSEPGAKADHGVAALTPVEVIMLRPGELRAVMEGEGGRAADVWSLIRREKAILRQQVVRNGRRSAQERLAHLILELHERLRAIGEADDRSFPLPIGQVHIADALGLSYVHVSRVFGALEKSGFLLRRRSEITVLDRPGLERLAGFSPDYLL